MLQASTVSMLYKEVSGKKCNTGYYPNQLIGFDPVFPFKINDWEGVF